MNKYSKQSASNLNQSHADLQAIFAQVLIYWDNTILVGHRGEEDQNEAFSDGRSKLKWPLSKHNKTPSMALDVTPYPLPVRWGEGNRSEYEKFRYFAFYAVGVADCLFNQGIIKHRLRWGGDWDGDHDVNDQDFNDLVHFELIEG